MLTMSYHLTFKIATADLLLYLYAIRCFASEVFERANDFLYCLMFSDQLTFCLSGKVNTYKCSYLEVRKSSRYYAVRKRFSQNILFCLQTPSLRIILFHLSFHRSGCFFVADFRYLFHIQSTIYLYIHKMATQNLSNKICVEMDFTLYECLLI